MRHAHRPLYTFFASTILLGCVVRAQIPALPPDGSGRRSAADGSMPGPEDVQTERLGGISPDRGAYAAQRMFGGMRGGGSGAVAQAQTQAGPVSQAPGTLQMQGVGGASNDMLTAVEQLKEAAREVKRRFREEKQDPRFGLGLRKKQLQGMVRDSDEFWDFLEHIDEIDDVSSWSPEDGALGCRWGRGGAAPTCWWPLTRGRERSDQSADPDRAGGTDGRRPGRPCADTARQARVQEDHRGVQGADGAAAAGVACADGVRDVASSASGS